MGLDMYLTGQKFFWQDFEHPENQRTEDGLRVKCIDLELGYWRKHPNLHGYIVQAFADGEDTCQEITLSALDIRNIISAVKERRLPKTEGFFFGKSDGSELADDVAIFERALAWLGEPTEPKPKPLQGIEGLHGTGMTMLKVDFDAIPKGESREVIYRASW